MLNCPTCVYADFEKDKCTRLLTRLPHICPYCEKRKPRNYFEMLKNMSMEEMAGWLYKGFVCPPKHDCPENEASCEKCWLEWLKEEVKDA